MAEDHSGARKDVLQQLAPWTKLFSAFKVALDPKKLLLAAAGILVMQLGWWLVSTVYFSLGSAKPPEWNNRDYPVGNTPEEKDTAWRAFKRDRQIWNLKYEMAGSPPLVKQENREVPQWVAEDIGDLANSPEEYEAIRAEKEKIEGELSRLDEKIRVRPVGNTAVYLTFGKEIDTKEGKRSEVELGMNFADKATRDALVADWRARDFRVRSLLLPGEGKNMGKANKIILGPYEGEPTDPSLTEVQDARKYKEGARTVEDIRAEVKNNPNKALITNLALKLRIPRYKAYGRLRTLPWFEDRGPNPYLLVTGGAARVSDNEIRYVPWERGDFIGWLLGDELPVLLEPLIKFFRPIVYVFDPAGGFWNRIYLFIIILWSLATWALFGGAITRIAAVQVARANERVGMTEALRFAWVRYKSYLCAPLFPLLFVFLIVVALMVFGVLVEWTYLVGDILGGVLWPLSLLAGLIMAVVLVGLVGWPLMYTTISAEGSDSFDAISRSYSYVYQAPWQYLWYSVVALAYGAVLIFFVGFMGSLTVYLSKWAVTIPPPLTESREPSYLFQWAPTSYGWRDLLLYKSLNEGLVEDVNTRGVLVTERVYVAKPDNQPNWHNYIGTFLVTIWLYLIFLMVIGFSYSYFWTASTIIYLLMRKKVDETELDEIHLEEEPEQPFPAPVVSTPPAEAPRAGPGASPVTMVESPTLRTPTAAPLSPPPGPPTSPPLTQSGPVTAVTTPIVAPPAHEPDKPADGSGPLGTSETH